LEENLNVGILAFEEVKGIFESDSSSLEQSEKKKHFFVQSLLVVDSPSENRLIWKLMVFLVG
jgi:hypothetical protein